MNYRHHIEHTVPSTYLVQQKLTHNEPIFRFLIFSLSPFLETTVLLWEFEFET